MVDHGDSVVVVGKPIDRGDNALKTILLVEDELEQRRGLRVGLMSKGYNVVEALNGLAALVILHEPGKVIDIVITDYSMPGMNGMELLKKVRELSRSLPMIIMTAYGEKALVIEALRNQCDSFIEKPFTIDTLVVEIERIKYMRLRNTDSRDLAGLLPRMVHQINNPLSAISWHAELGIFKAENHENVINSFHSIIKAVDALRVINNQIMQLGSIWSEEAQSCDLIAIIEESLGMFTSLMSLKSVLVERDYQHPVLWFHGQRNALEQAFKNLILNAVDAMDGKPMKILKLKASRPPGSSTISICCEDTGCGIPEDVLPHIFDPFFTRKQGGNGLGLAVVKEAIDKHDGTIRAESRLAVSTSIIIDLPVKTGLSGQDGNSCRSGDKNGK